MNHGPLVFLAAFVALSASWCGLVMAPQIQIGGELQQTNTVNTAQRYPENRPGVARQGAEIYRQEGCFYCHSQQVRQTGIAANVVLNEMGTNPVAVANAVLKANPQGERIAPAALAFNLPRTVLSGLEIHDANAAVKALQAAGAKSSAVLVPEGPDISRAWGKRRTVAADYLYDATVMLGSQRVGPDLADVGVRLPDLNWQLVHLYAPRAEVKDSIMPRYTFLFEVRRQGSRPSPEALQIPAGEFTPPRGYEVVPTPGATQLAAYLVSLRSDAPLFEAPFTPPPPPPAPTNAPAK